MSSSNVATHRAGHEAFNRRDFDAMVQAYTSAINWTDRARSLTFRTPEEFKNVFLSGWVQSSTDIQIVEPQYIDAGQTVLCTFTVVGTQDGPLGPFHATHKRFSLSLCELWHFDSNGRVVGGDLYYDQVSLLLQLGLMPQPAATAA